MSTELDHLAVEMAKQAKNVNRFAELANTVAAGLLEETHRLLDLQGKVKEHVEPQPEPAATAPTESWVEPEPQPEPEPTPEPEPEPEPAAPEVTHAQVLAAMTEAARVGKSEEMKQLLTDLGVGKLSDVKPEDYAKLLAGAKALM